MEVCRHLYNGALAGRKDAWENEKRSVNFAQQCASLPALKEKSEYLPNIHSQVLQDVMHRVNRSFENFFRRVKSGETPGYPRFKGEHWYDSFQYRQYGNGAKFDASGRLSLSKIGAVRVCKDRPLTGTPKTVSLTRRADGWYACIACDTEPEPLPKTGESVGADVGLEYFATLSNGETIANPRLLRRAERQLKTAQRRVSRRKRGSERRKKARVLLAKAHLKVRRARLDFCHKVAHNLVNRFDTITVEKLNIKGMVKAPKPKPDPNNPSQFLPNGASAKAGLNKSISEAGWGLFVSILTQKAESAARQVVAVNPAYTSQDCSNCGMRVPKKLSMRLHSCPYCGFKNVSQKADFGSFVGSQIAQIRCFEIHSKAHRDHNAALNILKSSGDTAFGETATLVAV